MIRPSIVAATDLVERLAVLLERLLGLVDEVLGEVLGVGELTHACASPACSSASFIIRSTSSGLRPEPPSIRICSLLVSYWRPSAETLDDAVRVDVEDDVDLQHAARRRRDADQLKLAQRLVVERYSDSPCSTWISTEGWLSSAVENVSDLRLGIVVLRSMSS